MNKVSKKIRVRGLVQGVGFRPTVWNIAKQHGISGDVCNDAEGVLIKVFATESEIESFINQLKTDAPPLSRIDSIEIECQTDTFDKSSFSIVESQAGHVQTGVVADAATCSACLEDIQDQGNRRYRYPFTNCTHCGPRLSIIRAIPYDRSNTCMSKFIQCESCVSEYLDPSDRRFHAQPNACPECGPKLWLEDNDGNHLDPDSGKDCIYLATELLANGKILAIKGIGGFHLACDATNPDAVSILRQRKRRFHKAFALMAKNTEVIERYAAVNDRERELLTSKAAPIVVLMQNGLDKLASEVAPGQNSLGFMLPYTPLHHVLMQYFDIPLVMTSGNLSEEPQVIDNGVARDGLKTIYDYALFHDRDIVNRLDDSVGRVVNQQQVMLRRARGYAPEPLQLPDGFAAAPEILAMGSELKNAFCLLKDGKAIISQHMGDLEDASTHQDYRHNLNLYKSLFEHQPVHVAVDMHPNYLSTQMGKEMAASNGLALDEVQHHHAHITSCMAEHGLALGAQQVLGIAMDGLGFGTDGSIWGGEFLLASYSEFTRLGHFAPIPMIGGAKAIKEPWRNTYAHLMAVFDWTHLQENYGNLELIKYLADKPRSNMDTMIERGLNAPRASSCGRFFDAVAAALGICREFASHEGQAAIEMEALVNLDALPGNEAAYQWNSERVEDMDVFSWRALWQGILDDLKQGLDIEVIAARFHQSMIQGIVTQAERLSTEHNVNTIVLSGGVFQNRILLEGVVNHLKRCSKRVLVPNQLPANDGGISLGQAVTVAARVLDK